MTTVERLIKNICEQRRLVIHQERSNTLDALKSKEEVSFRKLPLPVRNAFRMLVRAEALEKRAKKTIERYGFHAGYEHAHLPVDVSRLSQLTEKRKTEVRIAAEKRFRQLENLRTTVYVKALGKSPEEARTILTQLQRDVEKL